MTGSVITIAQRKGGSGKTTLAANLAVAWALKGFSVSAIDIDPQRSLAFWGEARQANQDRAVRPVDVEEVKGWRIRNEVERRTASHDLVLIDSPPHDETETRLAVRAADLVLVPVQPSPMDVWATRETLALADSEKTPPLLVLNRVPPRARLTAQMCGWIDEFEKPQARSRVGNRIALAAALAEGLGVQEAQPRGSAAAEIVALATEIERLLKKSDPARIERKRR